MNADTEDTIIPLPGSSRRLSQSSDSTYRRDPFNKPEHVNTLRGKELCLFVFIYVIAVIFIMAVFESIMPVMFERKWFSNGDDEEIENATTTK
ncbi:unnamed protein product [Bursaphelenchus xylophilus]|uniref:(pine wood nematode) hypothetical protein n=1 Tax=Bursaphelenchus xylophilus TaxID=6326 RepID=A0A1I7RQ70_BURXY|nr:unnamed protein product [Bursaphelenchus xylophilus]CAG9097252.1 unnamed protein product [Bursaphelenchus xylophilus]